MRVQRIKYPDNRVGWIVIGDDFLPIQPIQRYLQYCEALEYSPNTIQAYARHLRLYWEFLLENQLDWKTIKLDRLSDFVAWLRRPSSEVLLHSQERSRTERTVNTIISAVCSFYSFHCRCGEVEDVPLYGYSSSLGRKRFKPFLHHVTKGKPIQRKLLKLKEPKKSVQTLTKEQVQALIDACGNLRDKLLVTLLYETGMRIGQALGMRHEDIRSWDNEVHIVPREDNINQARAKRKQPYKVVVSMDLMSLYINYFTYEYPEGLVTDYVFVNIWEGRIGYPITYSTVSDLFERLRRKTGIKDVHPHMFRHTHATELIEAGVDMVVVKERLGHACIQTTINTYTHIRPEVLKKAYQNYLEMQEK